MKYSNSHYRWILVNGRKGLRIPKDNVQQDTHFKEQKTTTIEAQIFSNTMEAALCLKEVDK